MRNSCMWQPVAAFTGGPTNNMRAANVYAATSERRAIASDMATPTATTKVRTKEGKLQGRVDSYPNPGSI